MGDPSESFWIEQNAILDGFRNFLSRIVFDKKNAN